MKITTNGQSVPSTPSLKKRIQNYSYHTDHQLGKGYSSQVFLGSDQKSKQQVAIKVVNLQRLKQKKQMQLMFRQVKLLKQAQHANVIRCSDVLMTTNNCYIITQYCPQGDLASHLSKVGCVANHRAVPFVKKIAQALAHLHKKHILHRDLKPQNIFMKGMQPKLGDFGFAICTQNDLKENMTIGSPLYMSPQASEKRIYSTKNDIWALGITMFQIVQGRAPWMASTAQQLQEVRVKTPYHYAKASQSFRHLIDKCLQNDPSNRPTADQVVQSLSLMMQEARNIRDSNQCQKQNCTNNYNNQQIKPVSHQLNKQMRNNYQLLRWLINYSRFSAKLLHKLTQNQQEFSIRQQMKELSAKCVYMLISKLKKLEQTHMQFPLFSFQHFINTQRYSKIRSVAGQYYQTYMMMLSKLRYKYLKTTNLFVQKPTFFINLLSSMPISNQQSKERLQLYQQTMVLVESNMWASKMGVWQWCKKTDFQALVAYPKNNFNDQDVIHLEQTRLRLISDLQHQKA